VNSEELFRKQKSWAEGGLFLFRELLPLMGLVGRYSGWTPAEGRALGHLLTASARSSESVMLLCAYGQLWDAEVVARSVLEGSLKFAYILQDRAKFQRRLREYAEDLFQIGILKDHQKAADFLAAMPNPDSEEWKPLRDILISEAEQDRIGKQFPSDVRRALETQWGFTCLLRALTTSEAGLPELKSLAHGYSVASHIQHADYTGTSIAFDRDTRSHERRDAIHFAHLEKLISTVLASLMLRLGVGYRFVQQDVTPLKTAAEKIAALKRSFGTPYGDWMRIEYGAKSMGRSDLP
jgi:hypothetical protein